jgi:hypothetical protein
MQTASRSIVFARYAYAGCFLRFAIAVAAALGKLHAPKFFNQVT